MTNIAKLRSGEAVFSALYETAVGIDVHEKKMVACYQSSRFGNGELKTEHRDFGTTQRQLEELTAWCKNLNPCRQQCKNDPRGVRTKSWT